VRDCTEGKTNTLPSSTVHYVVDDTLATLDEITNRHGPSSCSSNESFSLAMLSADKPAGHCASS
jgi:hypothetical protein